MFKWISRLFSGDTNERVLDDLQRVVSQVNGLEAATQALNDAQIRGKTAEFRRRLAAGETLDDLMPEAFAVVRETARRAIGQRHHDVQLIGGLVLHQGKIAEMRTGEGKTLVATLPLYLNALEGNGVHLITVNDYLVRVGAGWMGPIYHRLGISVSYIAHDQSAIFDPDYLDPKANLADQRLVHWRPITRREAYAADITYGTNNEFGFDYLRDNIAPDMEHTVQRVPNFAIVDEVDNILIDEARTPLIISGPTRQSGREYGYFAQLVHGLKGIEEREYAVAKKELDYGNAERRAETQRKLDAADYVIDLKNRGIALTDGGTLKMERKIKSDGRIPEDATLYDPEHAELAHFLDNAVKAEYVYKRDKEYIVQDGEVVIVDEQTGRTMPGRRWSDGLHEAVEAKENVQVQQENVTMATVTIQNYFRMYTKLSGMTGTALTESEEFAKIYKLDVVPIPTHRDMVRDDYNDQIYRSEEAKYRAVAREVVTGHVNERPVLVGTASIENNERLSAYLKPQALRALALSSVLMNAIRDAKNVPDEIKTQFQETLEQPLNQVNPNHLRTVAQALGVAGDALDADIVNRFATTLEVDNHERLLAVVRDGLPYNVLNAKLHEQEAAIVAQAGRPGAITIATNMAGRGTDILLGGNPDSLAADYLAKNGVTRDQIKMLAATLVERGEMAAHQHVQNKRDNKAALAPVLVDELKSLRERNDEAVHHFDDNPALYLLERFMPGDATTFPLRWQVVNDVLAGEQQRAREAVRSAEGLAASLREEQIVEIQAARADLEAYRTDKVDSLATQLFDRIYAGRAGLIASVLRGDEARAQEIVASIPTLDEALIAGIRGIKEQVERDADAVRARGGLHIIGTERHEARRIDNQLRGRAGRQGDPGSSRFYISLEDELMRRFGPSIDRVKNLMGRVGFEDDMPLEFGIISKQIEGAQTKVEGYNFDMRKRVVDYDDVMNKQREVIYARRRAILEEGEDQRRIRQLETRYLATYAEWATHQVEELAASTNDEAEITAQLERVLPGASSLDRAGLAGDDEAARTAALQPLLEAAQAAHYPLRLLLEDVSEFIEVEVDEAFAELSDAERPAIEQYINTCWQEGLDGSVEDRTKELFRNELDGLQERYLRGYETWILGEIRQTVEAVTTQATNTINIEGAVRRLAPKLPDIRDLALGGISTPEALLRQLETLIRPSKEAGNHLRLFAQDLQALIPLLSGLSAQQFIDLLAENLDTLLKAMPQDDRKELLQELLTPVAQSLAPIFNGMNFTPEQDQAFGTAVTEAWMGATDRALALDNGAARGKTVEQTPLDEGLEALLDLQFDRWRGFIGVDLLNQYGRDLLLNALDREWVDYLTAMEELRQGISLQGLAQRDPLVSYKTQAFGMFAELLETIDRAAVQQFFPGLPRWVAQTQAQQMHGQVRSQQREIKVGPNELCPCGSGKKYKKCHGAPGRQGQGMNVPMLKADGNASLTPPPPPPSQEQAGQRRKPKGRNIPARRS